MATYWPALGPSRWRAAARCCYLHSGRRADREMLSANHRRISELLQGATIEASTIWATSSVGLQPSEPSLRSSLSLLARPVGLSAVRASTLILVYPVTS